LTLTGIASVTLAMPVFFVGPTERMKVLQPAERVRDHPLLQLNNLRLHDVSRLAVSA
jgi:hypothetical protein